MRHRSLLALAPLALMLVPLAADAQTRIPIGRRGPTAPAPMPPQAPGVAREYSYVRLPYSVESYPFISQFSAAGFVAAGLTTTWVTGGIGTRLDYRLTSMISLTLDATGDFLGGPSRTRSLELGTRFRTPNPEHRLQPYLDARVGYLTASDMYQSPFEGIDAYSPMGWGTRFSDGLGMLAGAGLEYRMNNWLSVTGSAGAMRSWMTMYRFQGNQPGSTKYTMDQYRYTLGLRFHPVRSTGPSLPQQITP